MSNMYPVLEDDETPIEWLDKLAAYMEKYSTYDIVVMDMQDPRFLIGLDRDEYPHAYDGETKTWKKIGRG